MRALNSYGRPIPDKLLATAMLIGGEVVLIKHRGYYLVRARNYEARYDIATQELLGDDEVLRRKETYGLNNPYPHLDSEKET